MNECLFCKIISGEIPSYTIYEDNDIKVFLDINPSTNGDCLIIPKKHFENIKDIDVETLKKIDIVSKKIYDLLKEKLHCDGLTFVQNNGFGQEIKHYHLHATPRYKNDELLHTFNKSILVEIENTFNKISK